MGFTLDPATGRPVYNNDITDPVGQFQEAVNYVSRNIDRTVPTFSDLANLPYKKPGMTVMVLSDGVTYGYLGASTGWKVLSEPGHQRVWRFPRNAASASDTFTAADNYAVVTEGTITHAPPGDYLVTATAVLSNNAMHPGFFRLTMNNLTHDLRLDLGGSPAPFTYTDTIMDFQGGDLTVGLSVRVTGGIATVQKAGTIITVAHLGRR